MHQIHSTIPNYQTGFTVLLSFLFNDSVNVIEAA